MVRFYTTANSKRRRPLTEPIMSFKHNPPKEWWKLFRYCVRCRYLYPKDTTFCSECKTLLRTRGRHAEKNNIKRY